MVSLSADLPADCIFERDYKNQTSEQHDPEQQDSPSLELIQATAHEGVTEGYPLAEYDTQPWFWASDVNLDHSFGEVSFDIFPDEEPGIEDGVPGYDDFMPIERFSLQPGLIPCVDLSKSAEDQGSWRPSCIRSQSVLGDSRETPILIPDSEDSNSVSDSIGRSPLEPNSSTGPTTDAFKEGSAGRNSYNRAQGSIKPCEAVMASRSWDSREDEQGNIGEGSPPSSPSAATASPLGDSLDVTIDGTHLATTTAMTTREDQSTQVSQSDKAAEVNPSHGCFDDLSEDELHGPSLYPVVRPKHSDTARKTGHMVRHRIPSPCFLWESCSDSDSSMTGAPIANQVVKVTVGKKRPRAPIRR